MPTVVHRMHNMRRGDSTILIYFYKNTGIEEYRHCRNINHCSSTNLLWSSQSRGKTVQKYLLILYLLMVTPERPICKMKLGDPYVFGNVYSMRWFCKNGFSFRARCVQKEAKLCKTLILTLMGPNDYIFSQFVCELTKIFFVAQKCRHFEFLIVF